MPMNSFLSFLYWIKNCFFNWINLRYTLHSRFERVDLFFINLQQRFAKNRCCLQILKNMVGLWEMKFLNWNLIALNIESGLIYCLADVNVSCCHLTHLSSIFSSLVLLIFNLLLLYYIKDSAYVLTLLYLSSNWRMDCSCYWRSWRGARGWFTKCLWWFWRD